MGRESTFGGGARLRLHLARVALTVAAAGLLGAGAVAVGPAAAAVGTSAHRTDPYSFDAPDAVAAYGNDLFVANKAGNSVTEVDARTGGLVRRLHGAKYGFDAPAAVLVAGGDVFVANESAGLTEFNAATGLFLRILRSHYGFADPRALASGGGYVYVLGAKGVVSRVDVESGSVDGIATGPSFAFHAPTAMVLVDSHVFVTNSASNTVTEINATTMKLIKILSAKAYDFDEPLGIAVVGASVWVTNYAGASVTVFSGRTGQLVKNFWIYQQSGPMTFGDGYSFAISPPGGSPMVTKVVPGTYAEPWMECNTNQPTPNFSNPQAAAVAGGHIWIVNEGSAFYAGGSLTELDMASGNSIRQVSGQPLK